MKARRLTTATTAVALSVSSNLHFVAQLKINVVCLQSVLAQEKGVICEVKLTSGPTNMLKKHPMLRIPCTCATRVDLIVLYKKKSFQQVLTLRPLSDEIQKTHTYNWNVAGFNPCTSWENTDRKNEAPSTVNLPLG